MTMETEIWKVIPGFERYEASSAGRIRRIATGRIMKQNRPKGERYKTCTRFALWLRTNKNEKKRMYVHRLVCMAFLPNPDNLPCVNHKDENGLNNNLSNLEWCDYKYNNTYGTVRERNGYTIRISKDDEEVGIFEGFGFAERALGLNRRCLAAVVRGKAKSYRGYKVARIL